MLPLLLLCSLPSLLPPAGAQLTTSRELYVKPTEDTSCPEPCHTLDEYVQNATQYFVSNTTFNFLPGSHNLRQPLNVSGITNLALVAITDGTVSITCQGNSSLSFTEITNLTIENLALDSCATFVLTDLLNLNLLGIHVKPPCAEENWFILKSTNVLGVSSIAGLHIIPSKVDTDTLLFMRISYNDHTTRVQVPDHNQLTLEDSTLPCPEQAIFEVEFFLDQSNYGVSLLLDNITVMFDQGSLLGLFFRGSAASNSVESSQVTIRDSCIVSGTLSVYDYHGPFVLNNVTLTSADGWTARIVLFNVTNLKFVDCKFTNVANNIAGTINCESIDDVNDGLKHVVVSIQKSSGVNFTNCEFSNNSLTPIALYDSTFILSGSNNFANNSALQGGAMAFYGDSYVTLANGSDTLCINNSAETVGGAIYIDYQFNSPCFFQLEGNYSCSNSTDPPALPVTMRFEGNVAENGGTAMYDASVDTCNIVNSSCRGWNFVNALFHINQRNGSDLSAITSEPLRACLCEDGKPLCTTLSRSLTVYPGETFNISAVLVGDRFGTVSGSVYAQLLSRYVAELGFQEHSQSVAYVNCTNLSYTVLSNSTTVSLVLTANSAKVTQRRINDTYSCAQRDADKYESTGYISPLLRSFPVVINITLLPCPLGFNLSDEPHQCICDTQLHKNDIPCNLATQTVQRSGTEWVNASFHNNMSNGVIVNKYCPNNYCKPVTVNISLEHPDTQCAFSRSGILCGGCQSGLSLVLGSAQCFPCSNNYLALLLPFALAGFALVFFIKLLNLTVATGTLNGLIFYANIVRANQVAWIPGQDNILTVFIAWFNLDLGIETCFFDGLDAYWKVWLNICFVVYLLAIMIVISVLCRYYTIVTKIFGRNLVQVLATLFLLLYLKLFRIVIPILQASTLVYPDGTSATVWSYDGNIPYFGLRHALLFLVALAIILFLWLPYTGILCFAQCLQRIPSKKITSIHMKLKPFLDAYFGPFKDNHRYWVGLLLLVRSALLVSLSALQSESVTIYLVTTVVGLVIYLGLFNQVYKNKYLSLLENSFLLNIGILAGGTLYISASGGNQITLAYTSVGVAFAEFVAIVAFHTVVALRQVKTRLAGKTHYLQVTAPNQPLAADEDINSNSNNYSAANVINRGAGHELLMSYDDYREPILKYVNPEN